MFEEEKWAAVMIGQYGQDGIDLVEAARVYQRRHPHVPDFFKDLSTYFQLVRRIPTELRAMAGDPVAQDLLFSLISHSRFGFDLIIRNRRMFWEIIQDRSFREIWGRRNLLQACREQLQLAKHASGKVEGLVRFHQYHTLRILLGDIGDCTELSSIVAELSDLTDVICECALDLAKEKYEQRYGRASTDFVVFGMGKLGGRELNYSSDIDLIFMYGQSGSTVDGDDNYDHHEYFKKVGYELIRILDEHHPNGRLYRVDMRLRPEGNNGELVLSYNETLNYYYTVGRHWERQAMIKARPIAGSIALGKRFLNELQPWIYSTSIAFDKIGQARHMRQQIEDRAQDEDLKAGVGGIRDIEFLVQHLQLLYGGNYPDLRSQTTIPALQEMKGHGLLPAADVDELIESYTWLRMAEHRLQMYEARQLHEVPTEESDIAFLAHRCDFEGADAAAKFLSYLNDLRTRVRTLADTHYLDDDEEQDALIAIILDQEPSDELIQRVLGPIGFKDLKRAAKLLYSLGEESFFILSRARTRRALIEILPSILALLQTAPDPDRTLFNLTRVVSAVGGRHYFYELMDHDPDLLITVVSFAGWANFLIDHLMRFTGLIDDVFESFDPHEMHLPDVLTEGRELVKGIHDPYTSLSYVQARELVRIAIYDLRGFDSLSVMSSLTRLAKALVTIAFECCAQRLAERWGWPERDGVRTQAAILGLGKLGSNELTYASDVDVIFVCESGGTCSKKDRDSEAFYTKVALDLSKLLEGIYEVDPRLRPWGDQGQLVVTPNTLKRYWSEDRDLWERLAMTRVAPICGDAALAESAVEIILNGACQKDLPNNAAESVRDMRKRLEHSVEGRDHLKRGAGGYVDVEFIAQYLCLTCHKGALPVGMSIRRCLTYLQEQGCIDATDAKQLKESLRILRGIEARMRLSAGRAISSIPTDEEERLALARRCAYVDVDTLNKRIAWARGIARPLFDKYIQ